MHGFEDIFTLQSYRQATLFTHFFHEDYQFRQRDCAGGNIYHHHHGEIALHDSLADVQDINVVFGKFDADSSNNAHLVANAAILREARSFPKI